MDVQIPDELQNLLLAVVGQRWPTGSENAMWAHSDEWERLRDAIDAAMDRLRGQAAAVQDVMDGEFSDGVVASINGLLKDLQGARDGVESTRKSLKNGAADLQQTKIMVAVQLALLLIQLFWLAYSLFGFLAVPAVIAGFRAVITAILRQVLVETLQELAEEPGLMLFIQLAQNDSGTREGVDWDSIGDAAIASAIGGAAGGLANALNDEAIKWLARKFWVDKLQGEEFIFEHTLEDMAFRFETILSKGLTQGAVGVPSSMAGQAATGAPVSADWYVFTSQFVGGLYENNSGEPSDLVAEARQSWAGVQRALASVWQWLSGSTDNPPPYVEAPEPPPSYSEGAPPPPYSEEAAPSASEDPPSYEHATGLDGAEGTQDRSGEVKRSQAEQNENFTGQSGDRDDTNGAPADPALRPHTTGGAAPGVVGRPETAAPAFGPGNFSTNSQPDVGAWTETPGDEHGFTAVRGEADASGAGRGAGGQVDVERSGVVDQGNNGAVSRERTESNQNAAGNAFERGAQFGGVTDDAVQQGLSRGQDPAAVQGGTRTEASPVGGEASGATGDARPAVVTDRAGSPETLAPSSEYEQDSADKSQASAALGRSEAAPGVTSIGHDAAWAGQDASQSSSASTSAPDRSGVAPGEPVGAVGGTATTGQNVVSAAEVARDGTVTEIDGTASAAGPETQSAARAEASGHVAEQTGTTQVSNSGGSQSDRGESGRGTDAQSAVARDRSAPTMPATPEQIAQVATETLRTLDSVTGQTESLLDRALTETAGVNGDSSHAERIESAREAFHAAKDGLARSAEADGIGPVSRQQANLLEALRQVDQARAQIREVTGQDVVPSATDLLGGETGDRTAVTDGAPIRTETSRSFDQVAAEVVNTGSESEDSLAAGAGGDRAQVSDLLQVLSVDELGLLSDRLPDLLDGWDRVVASVFGPVELPAEWVSFRSVYGSLLSAGPLSDSMDVRGPVHGFFDAYASAWQAFDGVPDVMLRDLAQIMLPAPAAAVRGALSASGVNVDGLAGRVAGPASVVAAFPVTGTDPSDPIDVPYGDSGIDLHSYAGIDLRSPDANAGPSFLRGFKPEPGEGEGGQVPVSSHPTDVPEYDGIDRDAYPGVNFDSLDVNAGPSFLRDFESEVRNSEPGESEGEESESDSGGRVPVSSSARYVGSSGVDIEMDLGPAYGDDMAYDANSPDTHSPTMDARLSGRPDGAAYGESSGVRDRGQFEAVQEPADLRAERLPEPDESMSASRAEVYARPPGKIKLHHLVAARKLADSRGDRLSVVASWAVLSSVRASNFVPPIPAGFYQMSSTEGDKAMVRALILAENHSVSFLGWPGSGAAGVANLNSFPAYREEVFKNRENPAGHEKATARELADRLGERLSEVARWAMRTRADEPFQPGRPDGFDRMSPEEREKAVVAAVVMTDNHLVPFLGWPGLDATSLAELNSSSVYRKEIYEWREKPSKFEIDKARALADRLGEKLSEVAEWAVRRLSDLLFQPDEPEGFDRMTPEQRSKAIATAVIIAENHLVPFLGWPDRDGADERGERSKFLPVFMMPDVRDPELHRRRQAARDAADRLGLRLSQVAPWAERQYEHPSFQHDQPEGLDQMSTEQRQKAEAHAAIIAENHRVKFRGWDDPGPGEATARETESRDDASRYARAPRHSDGAGDASSVRQSQLPTRGTALAVDTSAGDGRRSGSNVHQRLADETAVLDDLVSQILAPLIGRADEEGRRSRNIHEQWTAFRSAVDDSRNSSDAFPTGVIGQYESVAGEIADLFHDRVRVGPNPLPSAGDLTRFVLEPEIQGTRILTGAGRPTGRAFIDPNDWPRLGLDRVDLTVTTFARVHTVEEGRVGWRSQADVGRVPWDSAARGYVAAAHAEQGEVLLFHPDETITTTWEDFGRRVGGSPTVQSQHSDHGDFIVVPNCDAAMLDGGVPHAQKIADAAGVRVVIGRHGMTFLGHPDANIGVLPGPNGEPGELLVFEPGGSSVTAVTPESAGDSADNDLVWAGDTDRFGLADLFRASPAQEQAVSDRLGIEVGSVLDGSRTFGRAVLDRIDSVLSALPVAHVRDNPEFVGVSRIDGSPDRNASEYDYATRTINIVYPTLNGVRLTSSVYSVLNRGVAWERRLMDKAVLKVLAGVSESGDQALGIRSSDREVMAGVSAVLAHGNLLEWTVRHESGHAVDSRVGWSERFADQEMFGGWQHHRNTDGFARVAEALLTEVGVEHDADELSGLTDALSAILDLPNSRDLAVDTDLLRATENRLEAMTRWFPGLGREVAGQLTQLIRQAVTPDLARAGGRAYGFSGNLGWFSYQVNPEDHLVDRVYYGTNALPGLAQTLMKKAGVAGESYSEALQQDLSRWLWRSAKDHDPEFLEFIWDRFPDVPRDASERIDAFVRSGLAHPWTLPDGGGEAVRIGDRSYHVVDGDWVSYLVAARDQHGLSNYQFSAPKEWFAEAYSAFYDTKAAPRERLDPAVREWFSRELPRILEGLPLASWPPSGPVSPPVPPSGGGYNRVPVASSGSRESDDEVRLTYLPAVPGDWIERHEIDQLREQVSPRSVSRRGLIDNVEVSAAAVSEIVRDSHRRAGLEVPDPSAVMPQVDHRLRDTAYDYRLLVTPDGQRIHDLSIRLAVPSLTPDRARQFEAAADTFYNQRYVIGPGGDQFNVNLKFVSDAAGTHQLIGAAVADDRSNQVGWSSDITVLDMLHEVGHFLGLSDTYDLTGPNAMRDAGGREARWVLRRHRPSRDPGAAMSIMQTTRAADRPVLTASDLDQIAREIDEVPGLGEVPAGSAANSDAESVASSDDRVDPAVEGRSEQPDPASLRDSLRMFLTGDEPAGDPGTASGGAGRPDPTGTVDSEVNASSTRDSRVAAGTNPFRRAGAGTTKATAETTVVADPIDVTTGRMILTETDLVLPGLRLERTYRSDYRWGRSFGVSWASTIDQRLVADGDQVRYLAADGSVLTFALPAEGESARPELGRPARLTRLVGGGWMLDEAANGPILLFAPADDGEFLISDVFDGRIRWSFGRDQDGVVTSMRSSTGGSFTISATDGLVTAVQLPEPDGGLTIAARFGYDDDRQLRTVVNSSGEAERFEYVDGRIGRWDDRNGEWYTYTYDDAGRCIGTDGKGGYLSYRFAYTDGLTEVTDSLGAVRRYELNDLSQVIAETDPLGATTINEWDHSHRLQAVTDALGRTTRFEYDSTGRHTGTVHPDGRRSPVEDSAAAGTEAAYEYDHLGRVVVERTGAGLTQFGWTIEGELAWRSGPDGALEEFFYDGEGNLVEHISADGRRTVREYGAFDLVTAQTDEGGRTEYTYDTELRLTSITNPQGQTWSYTYDGNGRKIAETDFDGVTHRYSYDAAGQDTTLTHH
uniref:DUF6531 domain-containing protein n=1 Tax=Paractinoplanes polyasparticus TaxID=2856853 RepID=UPI001C8602FD|nr:DUF6531 domain-containing protein [Actinoplanes polyasparticus]